jgi:hypothetical protein
MKRAGIKYLALLAVLLYASLMNAQQRPEFPRVKNLLLERQLEIVKGRVNIDERDVPEFEMIYRNYIKDISAINKDNRTLPLTEINLDRFTDNEVEEIFFKQSLRAKELLEVREKYFTEFRKVLKAKDVITLFKVEREILGRAQMEMKRRNLMHDR